MPPTSSQSSISDTNNCKVCSRQSEPLVHVQDDPVLLRIVRLMDPNFRQSHTICQKCLEKAKLRQSKQRAFTSTTSTNRTNQTNGFLSSSSELQSQQTLSPPKVPAMPKSRKEDYLRSRQFRHSSGRLSSESSDLDEVLQEVDSTQATSNFAKRKSPSAVAAAELDTNKRRRTSTIEPANIPEAPVARAPQPVVEQSPVAGPSGIQSRPSTITYDSFIEEIDPDDVVPHHLRQKPSQVPRMRVPPPTRPIRPDEHQPIEEYTRGSGG